MITSAVASWRITDELEALAYDVACIHDCRFHRWVRVRIYQPYRDNPIRSAADIIIQEAIEKQVNVTASKSGRDGN